MCTLVLLRQPAGRWPLLIAANRDERSDRPWLAPGRHWPDRPEVIAGRDSVAGGSWMGLNDHGVVAAMLNRTATLGPAEGKRSRGDLVLEALDHADARAAVAALGDVNGQAYRPFNMVIADDRNAYWLRHAGGAVVGIAALDAGLSMLTARELNDPQSPRIRRFRPLFEADAPDPPADPATLADPAAWGGWAALLGRRDHAADAGWGGAMAVDSGGVFRTVCASLLAVPPHGQAGADGMPVQPVWLFAAGQAGDTAFTPVDTAPAP